MRNSADAERICLAALECPAGERAILQLNVVVKWNEELKRMAPLK